MELKMKRPELEDRELLSRLLEATCRELPEPKPRKKRAGE